MSANAAPMVVHLYAVCWNEEAMLPFFFRHYEPWVQRFVIYDNGSTDGTLALLSARPDVELRPFPWADSNSFVASQRALHNTCWRESRGVADWVVVTAIDEHLQHRDMPDYLRRCRRHGVTCIPALGYQMVTADFPQPDAHLAAVHTRGVPDGEMNKLRLFDPNEIKPHMSIGGHSAAPTGNVVYPERDEVLLLHYKYLGADYLDRRNQLLAGALRDGDRERRWGCHYDISRARAEAIVNWAVHNAVDVAAPDHVPWRDHHAPRFWRKAKPSTPPGLLRRLRRLFVRALGRSRRGGARPTR